MPSAKRTTLSASRAANETQNGKIGPKCFHRTPAPLAESSTAEVRARERQGTRYTNATSASDERDTKLFVALPPLLLLAAAALSLTHIQVLVTFSCSFSIEACRFVAM